MAILIYRIKQKIMPKKIKKVNIVEPGVFYFVDKNFGDSQSFLKQMVTTPMDAFSNTSQTIRQIEETPENVRIKIVVNTAGGELVKCNRILKRLVNHPAGYVAYIKNESYSAGSVLALGADEIVMDKYSCLGKIDPQYASTNQSFPVHVMANTPEEKIKNVSDHSLVSMSKHVMNLFYDDIKKYYKFNKETFDVIIDKFVTCEYPHHTLYDYDECKSFGLNVRQPKKEEMKYFA